MNNGFLDIISVEKYAAFLDGNLTPEEMQHVTDLIANNEALHQIHQTSIVAEDALSSYSSDDLKLPLEIEDDLFRLPNLEEPSILFDCSFNEVAACTYPAAEEVESFSKEESHEVELLNGTLNEPEHDGIGNEIDINTENQEDDFYDDSDNQLI